MRVFITGATGFVGSAIVQELIGAGHEIIGLARSQEAAAALAAAGAKAHSGALDDLESLRSGAAKADAVIHAGFSHDFANFAASCEMDRRAIETLGDALVGSNRQLIVTSGTGLLAPGRLATEDYTPPSTSPLPRVSEQSTASAVARGVHVSIIRLPPSVHGDGDHGFVPLLIGIAREKGVAAYIGEGQNRWPAVHRLDAAKVYRIALENNAANARYHAVAEEGVPFREIAGVISRHLNVPVISKSPEQAEEHFGWFTHFAALDGPASSARTQQELNWRPVEPGLIADLDRPSYFAN